MHSLPIFVRLRGKTVILIGDGDAADAKRRLIERAGGIISDSNDATDAALVFIAIEDAEEAHAQAVFFRAQGKLVNVVDRPELCDFTTPAIVDRNPVLIAVGTGGASAGLAKHIRLRLEALLPPSLGQLAERLFAVREKLRQHWPRPTDRRRAIDLALAPGGILDPLQPDSADRVDIWAVSGPAMTGVVRSYRIEIQSDDPDDLTLRHARLLGQADIVRHAPDIPPEILGRARADARLIAFGQSPDESVLTQGLTIWLDRAR
jgi:uroporphyrin-III C-methyltransferase / precorrin-2 dehydrogenase / sirohydrochlorin ferrochelatase